MRRWTPDQQRTASRCAASGERSLPIAPEQPVDQPAIEAGAGFRSLKDTWADTTTPHGQLMLTILGGARWLAGFGVVIAIIVLKPKGLFALKGR